MAWRTDFRAEAAEPASLQRAEVLPLLEQTVERPVRELQMVPEAERRKAEAERRTAEAERRMVEAALQTVVAAPESGQQTAWEPVRQLVVVVRELQMVQEREHQTEPVADHRKVVRRKVAVGPPVRETVRQMASAPAPVWQTAVVPALQMVGLAVQEVLQTAAQ